MRLPDISISTTGLMLVLSGCAAPPADAPTPPAATAVEAPAVDSAEADADPGQDGDGTGGHTHVAPHGGALAELGDHYAQLEGVVDPESGRITLYVFDGEAERPYRVAQRTVVAEVITDGEPFVVHLQAVASALTGERVGDTSEFRGTAPELAGATTASIRVETITVRGQTFDNVRLRWER
jgi:hypothetical protein